jgi:hypothetical protein
LAQIKSCEQNVATRAKGDFSAKHIFLASPKSWNDVSHVYGFIAGIDSQTELRRDPGMACFVRPGLADNPFCYIQNAGPL